MDRDATELASSMGMSRFLNLLLSILDSVPRMRSKEIRESGSGLMIKEPMAWLMGMVKTNL